MKQFDEIVGSLGPLFVQAEADLMTKADKAIHDTHEMMDSDKGAMLAFSAVGLIIIICFIQFSTLTNLKQIPGPIYGGDLYYHFGHINHATHFFWHNIFFHT